MARAATFVGGPHDGRTMTLPHFTEVVYLPPEGAKDPRYNFPNALVYRYDMGTDKWHLEDEEDDHKDRR